MGALPKFADESEEAWFRVYCSELLMQADYGIIAFDEHVKPGVSQKAHLVFPAIHSMLTAAANIDKIFRSAASEKKSRILANGRQNWLLPIFEPISDSAIFREARNLRNDLEHFDERI